MLTDVPLDRLLEGAAESLREEVAPHVGDPYGRMQLRAIDELLRNLAARTTWDVDEVAADAAAATDLADRVAAAGWSGAEGTASAEASNPAHPPGAGAGSSEGADGLLPRDASAARSGRAGERTIDRALAERRAALLRLRAAIRWAQAAGPEGVPARAAIEERLTAAGQRERGLLIAGMYG